MGLNTLKWVELKFKSPPWCGEVAALHFALCAWSLARAGELQEPGVGVSG